MERRFQGDVCDCHGATGVKAWELRRGVTHIKDNMSLRVCTPKTQCKVKEALRQ